MERNSSIDKYQKYSISIEDNSSTVMLTIAASNFTGALATIFGRSMCLKNTSRIIFEPIRSAKDA